MHVYIVDIFRHDFVKTQIQYEFAFVDVVLVQYVHINITKSTQRHSAEKKEAAAAATAVAMSTKKEREGGKGNCGDSITRQRREIWCNRRKVEIKLILIKRIVDVVCYSSIHLYNIL